MMFRFKSTAVAVLWFACAPVWADKSPVATAFDNNDVVALEALSRSAATADEKLLAKGAVLALQGQDEKAMAVLAKVAAAPDKCLRAEALIATGQIHLRRSRLAMGYEVMKLAQDLCKEAIGDEGQKTLDFVKALSGEKPMVLVHAASGRVPVTRDSVGLVRILLAVNGKAQEALVDTGAGISVLSASAAKTLGVRVLGQSVAVRSSTNDVTTGLAVADKLTIGDAELANVPVIVLPDSALTFGNFKVDAILGLPAMFALRRVAVVAEGGKEFFEYGPKADVKTRSNLMMAGVEPYVLAQSAQGPLRLLIDSGANASSLTSRLFRDYPALATAAVVEKARWGGAGGVMVDEKAQKLPEFVFSIGDKKISLKDISVPSKPVEDRHGVIGQDVLKQGKRWVMDFEAMSFVVSD